jgi:hypothetical protein
MDFWRDWHKGKHNFIWDVAQYYAYLPAKFCNNDSFDFKNGVETYLPDAPLGGKMPKMTYGMSLMYAPFFGMGYKIAVNQDSPRDGFSEPFATCIHWGSILYGLLGLVLLRNFLIKFYSEKVVALTLAICFFGTTLFYYTLGNGEMSHSYLFFLISAFLLVTYHWHQSPSYRKSLLLGLILALIVLIRPTEIFLGLVFLFWNVSGFNELKERMGYFMKYKWHLLIMLALTVLIWIPQFMFWREKAGTYFYFSYEGERFFWTDPQIVNILFSYRKGWITWSPLIILVFLGFFFMKGAGRKLRPVILILLVLNVYVLSCWWNWFFGGSLGARGFTQHIAYLSLPLAACCHFFIESDNRKKYFVFLRVLFFAFVFSGMVLSVGQSYQFSQRYIHFDAMTKEAYWHVFGKYYMDEEEKNALWQKLKPHDDKKLRSGEDRNQ